MPGSVAGSALKQLRQPVDGWFFVGSAHTSVAPLQDDRQAPLASQTASLTIRVT